MVTKDSLAASLFCFDSLSFGIGDYGFVDDPPFGYGPTGFSPVPALDLGQHVKGRHAQACRQPDAVRRIVSLILLFGSHVDSCDVVSWHKGMA